jgi:hydrogenase-4 transcriptional activator
MDDCYPLLLNLWREASRHDRINVTANQMFSLLREPFDLERLAIRRIDASRGRLETVLLLGPALEETDRTIEVREMEWSRLLTCCSEGRLFVGGTGELTERYPGLLPPGMGRELLVGGLAREGQPIGFLVLENAKGFDRRQASLAEALLEPFAVALDNDRHQREHAALREAADAERRSLLTRLKRQDIADTVVGAESGLKGVMERVDLVSRSDTPVLILGETGTGKEVVARVIHQHSACASGPFLRVNCGAIPPELIDSELFGHERGSFTGAVAMRKGWFERADGGTLFLDEVGELSLAAQVRLLRILQDGALQRVGGQQILNVDVRLVAATNRDLRAMVADGSFREDLWYRIAVFPIALPALQERSEDIPALASHFALRAAERLGLTFHAPSRDDLVMLSEYTWPGNIRELASVMERAAILGNGRGLDVAAALGVPPQPGRQAIPAVECATPASGPEAATFDEMAKRHVESVLMQTQGRVEGPFGAARILGLNPNTLRTRMRRLGIEPKRFRRH